MSAAIESAGLSAGSYATVYDGNGNITGLVKTTDGTRAASYEYGPFGEPLRATGAMAKANPFRWSTKYCDEETGLVYYGRRYYQPQTGRWLSRDPIEERGGQNLYGFCLNNAVRFVDRDGREIVFDGLDDAVAHAQNLLSKVKDRLTGYPKKWLEEQLASKKCKCKSKVVFNSKSVAIAKFELGLIDIGDIENLPKSGPVLTAEATFLHELVEQWESQCGGSPGYDQAHFRGLQAEEILTGSERIRVRDATGALIDQFGRVRGAFGTGYINGYYLFRFKLKADITIDGKFYKKDEVVEQRVNMVDGNVKP